jgi:hypothetical protein
MRTTRHRPDTAACVLFKDLGLEVTGMSLFRHTNQHQTDTFNENEDWDCRIIPVAH